MFKLYKYIFYRYYSTHLAAHGEKESPWEVASLALSLLVYLNFMHLSVFFDLISGIHIWDNMQTIKVMALILLVLTIIVNYFVFIRKKRYRNITDEFKSEGKKDRQRGTIIIWSVFPVTILLNLLAFYLRMKLYDPG